MRIHWNTVIQISPFFPNFFVKNSNFKKELVLAFSIFWDKMYNVIIGKDTQFWDSTINCYKVIAIKIEGGGDTDEINKCKFRCCWSVFFFNAATQLMQLDHSPFSTTKRRAYIPPLFIYYHNFSCFGYMGSTLPEGKVR